MLNYRDSCALIHLNVVDNLCRKLQFIGADLYASVVQNLDN